MQNNKPNNHLRKPSVGFRRLYVVAFIAAFIMMLLLVLWSYSTSIDHKVINSLIISKQTTNHKTVYTLDISTIKNLNEYSLHFKSYGNTIRILADDNEIYSYGHNYAQKHLDIGRIYVSAFLPESAETMMIELTPADKNASSNLKKIDLCALKDSSRYYLSNDTLGFPLSLIYIVLGFGGLLTFFAVSRYRQVRYALFFFSLIMICMSIELADTGGHYLVLFQNQYAWNILFYIASYILPIAAPCYGYMVLGDRFPKRPRNFAFIGVWISIACGTISTILFLITDLRFCDFYFLSRISLIASVSFGIYSIIYVTIKKLIRKKYLPFIWGTIIWGLTALLMSYALMPTINMSSVTPMDSESLEAILLLVIMGVSLCSSLLHEANTMQKRKWEVLELQKKLQDMRFKAFTSQMQPHFLFNTLSSIKQIIYENPNYAAKLLTDFTVHLRSVLRSISNDRPISFSEELKNIKAYVNIEKVRFGDKLTVVYDIQSENFDVIPLSIQPLVENSIRHGIYERAKVGGNVTIRTTETVDSWIIKVIDTGVGFDVQSTLQKIYNGETDSTGLKSLIYRIENLMDAKVVITSTINKGTEATVTIPKSEVSK